MSQIFSSSAFCAAERKASPPWQASRSALAYTATWRREAAREAATPEEGGRGLEGKYPSSVVILVSLVSLRTQLKVKNTRGIFRLEGKYRSSVVAREPRNRDDKVKNTRGIFRLEGKYRSSVVSLVCLGTETIK
eukprot:1195683-Prorocentrum_minimum.AAC.9